MSDVGGAWIGDGRRINKTGAKSTQLTGSLPPAFPHLTPGCVDIVAVLSTSFRHLRLCRCFAARWLTAEQRCIPAKSVAVAACEKGVEEGRRDSR